MAHLRVYALLSWCAAISSSVKISFARWIDANGKATGVVYVDSKGVQHRQKARVVCIAGNSIESPRLLLNSASSLFPQGLANSSGQVGKNYMRHTTGSVFAEIALLLQPYGLKYVHSDQFSEDAMREIRAMFEAEWDRSNDSGQSEPIN